ncbi:MAG: ABC transporter permease subunit [Oscillospiraceae bacterium]|nr:ABC transporter permease subunit [Oscillospiraceae bacterium]
MQNTAATKGVSARVHPHTLAARIYKYRYFYLIMLPSIALLIIFKYIPMAGVSLAFTKYTAFAPPKFIGWDNFKELIGDASFLSALKNTLILSLVNLFLGMLFSIGFALLINEIHRKLVKSVFQTILYIPHFISWVVTASIFYLILSPSGGLVNQLIVSLGGKSTYFMISEKWWTPIFYLINLWKGVGWGMIIYIAALSGISDELYEAASIDGAGRLKQTWYITLPGIMNTILVVLILHLASVLNIFQPVFVLQNDLVLNVSEVIETYIYRVGLLQSDYGYSTAVGLFKSVISMILILVTNNACKKIKGEGIL